MTVTVGADIAVWFMLVVIILGHNSIRLLRRAWSEMDGDIMFTGANVDVSTAVVGLVACVIMTLGCFSML